MIMKPINGFKEAEPIIGGGTVYTLPSGNYEFFIMDAKLTKSKSSNRDMLQIAFDVAEGQYADFYRKKFEADKKRDPSKAVWDYDAYFYQLCDEQALGRFKGFIKCLEDSNPSFSWDWDESKLRGLRFAGQTRNEQSLGNNGKVYDHNKLVNIYPVSELENLPKLSDKTVKQESVDFGGGFGGSVADNSDIPF